MSELARPCRCDPEPMLLIRDSELGLRCFGCGRRIRPQVPAAAVRVAEPPRRDALDDVVAARIDGLRAMEPPMSFTRIADLLNRDGVPTLRGGRGWHASSVRSVWLTWGKRRQSEA